MQSIALKASRHTRPPVVIMFAMREVVTAVQATTGAVNTNTGAVQLDTTQTVNKFNEAIQKFADAVTYMSQAVNQLTTSNSLLDQLRALNNTSSSQLQLLNQHYILNTVA